MNHNNSQRQRSLRVALIKAGITAVSALFVMEATADISVHDKAQFFKGYAYDLKSNELVYTETHKRDESGLLTTEYKDPQGDLIANREISFMNDIVANFTFNSKRSGFNVSVDRLPQEVSYTRLSTKGEVSGLVAYSDAATSVIDAGFNDFILRNWDELSAGEKKKFTFFQVGKGRWVKLQIKGNGAGTVEGIPTQKFIVQINMPILRLFVKPIEVHFYKDTQELALYKGISNINNEKLKTQNVKIIFPRNEFVFGGLVNN